MAKCVHQTLLYEDKLKVIESINANDKKKYDIAKQIGILVKTLLTTLKKQSKYESLVNNWKDIYLYGRDLKVLNLEDFEECVTQYLKQCRDKYIPISRQTLQKSSRICD